MYGCLSVGVHAARAIAAFTGKPLVGIHHMQAHALTPLLTEEETPKAPFLNLLVSGGHTMLVLTTAGSDPSHFQFEILAKSADDSIGDAYDKTARLLQIPWLEGQGPGPSLEAYALPDNKATIYESIPPIKLPMPKELTFSYAGLKFKMEKELAKLVANIKMPIPKPIARAMARRFQDAAVGQVVQKVEMALDQLHGAGPLATKMTGPIKTLVVSGGVASNTFLRNSIRSALARHPYGAGIRLCFPPIELCTDNAAMIAWAGVLRLQSRQGDSDPFDQPIMKKWPIGDL